MAGHRPFEQRVSTTRPFRAEANLTRMFWSKEALRRINTVPPLSSPEGNSMALLQSVRRWFTRDQPLDLEVSNLITEPMPASHEAAGAESGFKSARVSTTTMVDDLDQAESARFAEKEPDESLVDLETPVSSVRPPRPLPSEPSASSSLASTPSDVTPLASMNRIEGAINEGRAAQDRIAESVSNLPRAISALDQAAARQQHVLDLLEGLASHHQDQAGRSTVAIERMTESIERSHEVTGLVQRQLDANHQIAIETVARLDQVSHAISESNQTSRAVGEAMAAMINEIRDRDQAQEERAGVLQGWIVASVVGCIAASAAALALAWAVMGVQG